MDELCEVGNSISDTETKKICTVIKYGIKNDFGMTITEMAIPNILNIP